MLETIFLLSVFLAGAIFWITLFNFGLISPNYFDWPKEFAYYGILQEAIAGRAIPYQISATFHGTERLMAIPEIILSPQILLLSKYGIGQFIVAHILLLYAVGFLGCLMFKQKYKMSMVSFIFLFTVFSFNGYIVSHLAVGHTMWAGYFLLPCLFYGLMNQLEGGARRKTGC